jgi:pimeloyl-ACP methyl ester carboxylesterase
VSDEKHKKTPAVRWSFIARSTLIILAVGYLAACGGLYVWQEEMIFVGAGQLPNLPAPPTGWEHHPIEHDQGQGVAWFFRQKAPGPAVIMMHGNGESIRWWPGAAQPWIDRGYSVLLPELRGYAGTDGTPNAVRVASDMVAWRTWLDRQSEVVGPIAYHGYSLGGGVMTQLAATHPPDLLVLQSTFTDIPSMAPIPVPRFLVENEFDTLSVVQNFDAPVVVIHGEHDEVIPVKHGAALAAAAGVEMVRFDGGHGGPPPGARAQMWRFIDAARGH